VLSRYDGTGLRRVAVATAAGGLACHVVGSLRSGAVQPWAALAAVAATLALARYVLLLGRGVGQQPEAALQDAPMLACAASWTVLIILAALP